MLLGVWPERAILVKHLSDFSPHFALSGPDRPLGKIYVNCGFMRTERRVKDKTNWIVSVWGLLRRGEGDQSPEGGGGGGRGQRRWGGGVGGEGDQSPRQKGKSLLRHWQDLTNGLSSSFSIPFILFLLFAYPLSSSFFLFAKKYSNNKLFTIRKVAWFIYVIQTPYGQTQSSENSNVWTYLAKQKHHLYLIVFLCVYWMCFLCFHWMCFWCF